MRIAVASGKGGTGKTTVAVNLAVSAARVGLQTAYVDCDVEEPNGHIYLKPENSLSLPVAVEVPEIDEALCTVCGKCGKICEFRAIAVLGDRVMVFPELCHGCGGCFLVCPVNATERGRRIAGRVESGVSKIASAGGVRSSAGGDIEISVVQGILKVKEAMPLPVIREVKKLIPDRDIIIIDCPPGNSCPMVESVRGADRVILVTEPTPFGLNDLEIALETVREMGIPVDIILNRCDPGGMPSGMTIGEGSADVIARIPEFREMARIGSRGELAIMESVEFSGIMDKILEKTLRAARGGKAMKELVVISGKGGTGKTSIAASMIDLSDRVVAADCDVDAANLHLVLKHEVRRTTAFQGGKKAVIDDSLCTSCGKCAELCRFDAIANSDSSFHIDKFACEGCGVCAYFCPERAITLHEEAGGEWFLSDADSGPMVHARLTPGGENSGKLVTIVRSEAKGTAEAGGYGTIIVDGAPGIGCPVIASITGADAVLVVVEPTLSGMHDMQRALELAGYFGVKAMLAINRYDINEEIAEAISGYAADSGIALAGRVRYDPDVTRAQMHGMSVVEYSDGPAAADIRRLWEAVVNEMDLEV